MRTSNTHPLRIDSFPLNSGWVGMTLCPGRKGPSESGPDWNRDLGADVGRVRDWDANIVVSLTEQAEMVRLGVGNLGSVVQGAGIEWLHLPIPDTGIPDDTWVDQWHIASPTIHQVLANGGRVVIHCKAGLERTALVATLVQCEHGRDLTTALSVIADARAGAGPLPNQRRWLETHLTEDNRYSGIGTIDTFILDHPAIATETAEWADGTIRLSISTHLVQEAQVPSAATTSGRCIVLANDSVLMMRNPGGYHILPGGRREPGETVLSATIRELWEETGLQITELSGIGIQVFRHLTPKPQGYQYPYPVFLNAIFMADASQPHSLLVHDDYEESGEFVPMETASEMISTPQRLLLEEACRVRGLK